MFCDDYGDDDCDDDDGVIACKSAQRGGPAVAMGRLATEGGGLPDTALFKLEGCR